MTIAWNAPRARDSANATRLSVALLAVAVLVPVVGEAVSRLLAVPSLLPLWERVVERSLLSAAIWIPLTPLLWSSAAIVFRMKHLSMRFVVIVALALLATMAEAAWSRWVYDAAARDPLDWWLGRGIRSLFTALAILVARTARVQLHAVRDASDRLHRREMALRKAELFRLDRQLQPHFLYNALNTIAEMVHGDAALAERLVSTVRRLFDQMGVREVDERSLREEVEALEPYLEIQQARFDHRLIVDLQLSRSAHEHLVPALILQPLVENAIRHGVERSTEGGRIAIEASERAGVFEVVVRNTVPRSHIAASNKGEGIGLRNARERLTCLYGASASLSFRIDSAGTALATVRLPARRAAQATLGTVTPSGNDRTSTPTSTNIAVVYRRMASPWRVIALSVVGWAALFMVSTAWGAFVAWQTQRGLRDVVGTPSGLLRELTLYVLLTAVAILTAAAPWGPRVSSQRVFASQLIAATIAVLVGTQVIALSTDTRIAKLAAASALATSASVLSAILVTVTGWRWYVDQLAVLLRTDRLEHSLLWITRGVSRGIDPKELSARLERIAGLVRSDPMLADASVVELADVLRATLDPAGLSLAHHV